MASPSDVRELELQGHRYLVVGALEHEPIVCSFEPPGFALLADEGVEILGADFQGALQRLLAAGEQIRTTPLGPVQGGTTAAARAITILLPEVP